MSSSKSNSVDVIVLGGGPAGLSVAALLARLGRSVVVLERGQYERIRAGETFGGELQSLLQTVGFWDDFQNVPRTPFRGVRSSWGNAPMIERASVFNPFGDGWHVNRKAFDAQLALTATRAGVNLQVGVGTLAVARVEDNWSVKPASREPVTGRFLVDASGRGARASAACIPSRRWLQMDRMVAVIGRVMPPITPIEPVLELEAVEEGWWYSAPQPDGRLIVTLMTDADLLPPRPHASSLSDAFSTALARTEHTSRRCGSERLDGPPWIVRADTGVLLPDRGADWIAIGDAAMGCDPLAGDGVVRSLRSAIDATPMIERTLAAKSTGTKDLVPSDDTNELRQRFSEYLDLRARYYLSEKRFINAPFWVRRHPMNWRDALLFLDPRQSLQWNSIIPSRDLIAPVEALISPHALRVLLRQLQNPVPAHEALATLRSTIPLEDRCLLVALQELIARGILATC